MSSILSSRAPSPLGFVMCRMLEGHFSTKLLSLSTSLNFIEVLNFMYNAVSELSTIKQHQCQTTCFVYLDPVLGIGCVAAIGSQASERPAFGGDALACRTVCGTQNGAANLAFHKDQSCACAFHTVLGSLDLAEGCQEDSWHVSWATHATVLPADWQLQMEVNIIKPTDKSYIRPGETVVFNIQITSPEIPVFTFDFGDGSVRHTAETTVGHAWRSEGSYDVSIQAESRTLSEIQNVPIVIEFVAEGIPPEGVRLKADTIDDELKQVAVYLDAYSTKTKQCSVKLRPGVQEDYSDIDQLVFSTDLTYTYPSIGLYPVTLTCSNDFGNSSDSEVALSLNPNLEFESLTRNSTLTIPVSGVGETFDNIVVMIDDEDKTGEVIKSLNVVQVHPDVFEFSGEHSVMVLSHGKVLLNKVFNLVRGIDTVSIEAGVIHATVDQVIDVDFVLGKADFLHVSIDYGDGTMERLLIPSTDDGIRMEKKHSFSRLGKYIIQIDVANDVSSYHSEQMVSIERPIHNAEMRCGNVTWLGTPSPCTFYVDMSQTPAMPFTVTFDYGNTVVETVDLGEQNDTVRPVAHQYVYPQYGIYKINAIVKNNISSYPVSALVQVGENITSVDLSAEPTKVEENGELVTFSISVPRGMPLYVELYPGEGDNIIETVIGQHPVGAEESRTEENVDESEPPSGPIEQEQDNQQGSDAVEGGKRRKREAGDAQTTEEEAVDTLPGEDGVLQSESSSSDTQEMGTEDEQASDEESDIVEPESGDKVKEVGLWPPPTPPPNEIVVLSYQYKTAGTYFAHVKVSNNFSYEVTSLCPLITVAPKQRVEPTCSKFQISLTEPHPETQALVKMRSEQIVIGTSTDSRCPGADLTRDYSYRYTWECERKTEYNEWRPELNVCETEIANPELVIPPNSLWYGTYKLSARMTLRKPHSLERARREADAELTQTTLGPDINNTHLPPVVPRERVKTVTIIEPRNDLLTSDAMLLTSDTVETYLQIVPSPLVAAIKSWEEDEKRVHTKSEIIKLDMSASHDPDVVNNNKTGMTMHMFCYVKTDNEELTSMTLPALQARSEKACSNIDRTTIVYDTDRCFSNGTQLFVDVHELNIWGGLMNMDDDVIFDLIITKDDRMARVQRTMRVYPALASNAEDALADMLLSGDINGILSICDVLTTDGAEVSEVISPSNSPS